MHITLKPIERKLPHCKDFKFCIKLDYLLTTDLPFLHPPFFGGGPLPPRPEAAKTSSETI